MTKTKQDRLKEVYEYVRAHYDVHTQADFAEVLSLTRPALSAAMNGNEAYLTDNLFKRICAAYQGVFNLDYLKTGKGMLLMESHDPSPATMNAKPTADIVELYAQRIRLVDDLRTSLREEIDEVKAVRAELQQTVTRLNRAIRELNKKSGTKAAEK